MNPNLFEPEHQGLSPQISRISTDKDEIYPCQSVPSVVDLLLKNLNQFQHTQRLENGCIPEHSTRWIATSRRDANAMGGEAASFALRADAPFEKSKPQRKTDKRVFPWLPLLLIGLLSPLGSLRAEHFQIFVPTTSSLNAVVCFDIYLPGANPGQESPRPVLLLIPGYNGNGGALLAKPTGWTQFADQEQVILVAPTFRTDLEEIRQRRGYYHPEYWSGQAVFEALDELAKRTSIHPEKLFLFGFSAGAHFAHRFALWRPDRVGAFVAYSAAWWDAPTSAIKRVPALIMCGEDDHRLNASLAFAQGGLAMGCPWIWRSYAQTGHELTPEVLQMARVFLSHYIRKDECHPQVGDIQKFQIPSPEEAESLPAVYRVVLPSKEIAEVWAKESSGGLGVAGKE